MKKTKLLWLSALPLTQALAGGSKSEDKIVPGSAQGKAASCASICEKAEMCSGEADPQCETDCRENESLSGAGQAAISKCLSDVDCEGSEAELLAAFLCIQGEARGAALSEKQASYCSDSLPKIQACNDVDPTENPLGSCEDQVSLVTDQALEGVVACSELACEAMQTCLLLEVFRVLGAEAVGLEDGEAPSANLIGNFLALFSLASQWGLEEGSFDFGTFFPGDDSADSDSGMAGATGR